MRGHYINLLMAVVVFALTLMTTQVAMANKIIEFSGYTWEVKSGYEAPGKNNWREHNVWVDEAGRLHLKITESHGKWYCAEIHTLKSFAPGQFQFQVEGPVGELDRNVVLGLFLYPDPKGPAEENEVDIEFARWGKQEKPAGSYTVMGNTHPYDFQLNTTLSTHVMTWGDREITFQSFSGNDSSNLGMCYNDWTYRATEYAGQFPLAPLRLHLNLWLFRGHPPANAKEQEIVIDRVMYQPL